MYISVNSENLRITQKDSSLMKILLASPRGFCAGVNRAISALYEALRIYGQPLYVFHEIVHNTWVVQDFFQHGVHFVDTINDVPAGATLMFSAHGVSPQIRRRCLEKNIHIIDATCPLVTRNHNQAIRLAASGRQIVLIGHAGHDEIVGIVEEAPTSIQVICSETEAEMLTLDPTRPVAYLTQTTLSTTEAEKVIAVLKRRFPEIQAPQTSCICFATQNRQRAITELTPYADIAMIVGSRNSSNSRRMWELAQKRGVTSYLVDGPEDVDLSWFMPSQTILITAGASAPETIVQNVIAKIQEKFSAEVEEREICVETLQFNPPKF